MAGKQPRRKNLPKAPFPLKIPIPSREEVDRSIKEDQIVVLPAKRAGNALLAWRGYIYNPVFKRWACIKRHEPCSAKLLTNANAEDCQNIGNADLVGEVVGRHSCQASCDKIYALRAEADVMRRAIETTLPPEEILKEIYDREPDSVRRFMPSRRAFKSKIVTARATAARSAGGRPRKNKTEKKCAEFEPTPSAEATPSRIGKATTFITPKRMPLIEPGEIELINLAEEEEEEEEQNSFERKFRPSPPTTTTQPTAAPEDDQFAASDSNGEFMADTSMSSPSKTCVFCSLSFSESTYRRHLYQELDDYTGKTQCPECAVDCRFTNKMIDHVFFVHGGMRKFVCGRTNCSMAFWLRDELLSHERSQH